MRAVSEMEVTAARDLVRAVFCHVLVGGGCASIDEVYEEVCLLTGLEHDALCVLLWGRAG